MLKCSGNSKICNDTLDKLTASTKKGKEKESALNENKGCILKLLLNLK